jgi:hypothetical protein
MLGMATRRASAGSLVETFIYHFRREREAADTTEE